MAERIYSIDSMRLVTIGFIVTIHTRPFRGLGVWGNGLNFVIDTTARFGVPFFFLVSGYLFAVKTNENDIDAYYLTYSKRTWSIYLFGLLFNAPLVLLVVLGGALIRGQDLLQTLQAQLLAMVAPHELVYYGYSVVSPLWFLPALFFSVTLVYLFVRSGKTAAMLPAALGFHLIGLLGESYTMVVDIPVRARDALFFGFFYTAVGYTLSRRDWEPTARRSRLYLGATICFCVVHLLERYTLGYVLTEATLATEVYTSNFSVGTALFSISLFVFLLSRPTLGNSTRWPAWGKYALGIYVIHPGVRRLLLAARQLLGDGGSPSAELGWQLAFTPLVFFGALGLYIALDRIGFIEIEGSHVPSLRRVIQRAKSRRFRRQ